MRNLGSVMVKQVQTLQPDTNVRDAANKMKQSHVGVLPVVRDGQVIGMLTDRDIVVRAIAEGVDPSRVRAADVMSRDIVSCDEDEDLSDAVRLMEERQVGRVVVLNRRGQLKGILSLGDLTQELGKERLASLVKDRMQGPFQWQFLSSILLGTFALVASITMLSRQSSFRKDIRQRIDERRFRRPEAA